MEVLVFEERGKSQYLKKNLTEQVKNRQQTQLTCDAGARNRTQDHQWFVCDLTTVDTNLSLCLKIQ